MSNAQKPTLETPANGFGRSNACMGGQHSQCRSQCSCACHR
jgi:hypothetical protein